jgi:hypothetical protein
MEWITDNQSAKAAFNRIVRSVQTSWEVTGESQHGPEAVAAVATTDGAARYFNF